MILVGSLFSAATSAPTAATPTTALPTLATPTSAGAKQAGWGFTVALADQIGEALEPGVSGDKADALSGAILHGMSSFITRIVPSPPGPPPNPPSPPPSPPPPPPPSPPSPPPSPPSPPPSCVGLESVSQVALGTCASLSLAPADASSKLLGDDAADALVSSLEESTIGELFLDGNTVGDRGAASLAGLVERSRLSRLSLVDNSVTDAGAYRLADAARWSETLHALDLDGNPIGADGAVYLAEALAYNRALRVLSLRRTGLESASASSSASSSAASASSAAASSASSLRVAEAFGRCLAANEALEVLSLGSLSTAAAEALVGALRSNSVLTTLDLGGGTLSDRALSDLALRRFAPLGGGVWRRPPLPRACAARCGAATCGALQEEGLR